MASDRFNPLFLFEIRQVVRNRAILVALCLYLIAQVAFLGNAFFNGMTSAHRPFGADDTLGKNLAQNSLYLMFFSVNGLLLLYSVTTTVRQGFDELWELTPLESCQVIRGKIAVAALISALFYAVALPFLTVAWLLRGVDALLLLMLLVMFFCTTQTLNLYVTAMFIRCKSIGSVTAAIFGLVVVAIPVCMPALVIPSVACGLALFRSLCLPFIAIYMVCLLLAFVLIRIFFSVNWDVKTSWERFMTIGISGFVILFFVYFIAMPLGLVFCS